MAALILRAELLKPASGTQLVCCRPLRPLRPPRQGQALLFLSLKLGNHGFTPAPPRPPGFSKKSALCRRSVASTGYMGLVCEGNTKPRNVKLSPSQVSGARTRRDHGQERVPHSVGDVPGTVLAVPILLYFLCPTSGVHPGHHVTVSEVTHRMLPAALTSTLALPSEPGAN